MAAMIQLYEKGANYVKLYASGLSTYTQNNNCNITWRLNGVSKSINTVLQGSANTYNNPILIENLKANDVISIDIHYAYPAITYVERKATSEYGTQGSSNMSWNYIYSSCVFNSTTGTFTLSSRRAVEWYSSSGLDIWSTTIDQAGWVKYYDTDGTEVVYKIFSQVCDSSSCVFQWVEKRYAIETYDQLVWTDEYSVDTYVFASGRPAKFTWADGTIYKNQGQTFDITASEWNILTQNINDMRVYWGNNQYTFTTRAVKGNPFYAYMYNDARTAIQTMKVDGVAYSYGTYIPQVYSGQTITADCINALVEELNIIP